MSVLRLDFECKGQDFLWWEVDADTGRIMGCGPLQAETWASGRCSIDMASLKVGGKPIFHGPATEPEGRRLKYRVTAIRPAGTGGGVASMRELTPELIKKVATGVAEGDWSYGRQSATGTSLAAELEAQHGARFRTDREPMRMAMAGVRASSTGGWPALFNNWVTAARRKLVQP